MHSGQTQGLNLSHFRSRLARTTGLWCLSFNNLSTLSKWPVWHNGRAFARGPKGRGFESRPVRFQVTALDKLLTRMCLYHQAV